MSVVVIRILPVSKLSALELLMVGYASVLVQIKHRRAAKMKMVDLHGKAAKIKW